MSRAPGEIGLLAVLAALLSLLARYRFSAVGIIAAVLLSLAILLMLEAYKTVRKVLRT